MFNDYLANEEAKEHIQLRVQEAEAFRLHQRVGAGDAMFWPAALALVALIGVALVIALT